MLLALVALVAEVFLYFFVGISVAFSGNREDITPIASFFVWLMVMTAALGVLSPVSAFIEHLAKNLISRFI